MKNISRGLAALKRRFGPQGWWPRIVREEGEWRVVHRTGKWKRVKRPSPFEVALGAILTQSTGWRNAEQALSCLARKKLLTPRAIAASRLRTLETCIRSSGYFRQKSKKLRIMGRFLRKTKRPSREELLALWGIGSETADTILLYGFQEPCFVVDAYTRRWLAHVTGDRRWLRRPYEDVRAALESAIPRNVKTWQEAHALIVAWGKVARPSPKRHNRPHGRPA